MLPSPSRVLQSLVASDLVEEGMFKDVVIPATIILKAMLVKRYFGFEQKEAENVDCNQVLKIDFYEHRSRVDTKDSFS
jgi:hypothetical protein